MQLNRKVVALSSLPGLGGCYRGEEQQDTELQFARWRPYLSAPSPFPVHNLSLSF